MKTFHEHENRPAVEASPTVVTVRIIDNAGEAETVLPLSVLSRLCSTDVPSRVRQCNVCLSQVIVALDGDSAVGFAAFRATSLQKQGRRIWFLLTDLDGGDFKLELTWPDETSRSIQTFCTRAAPMAEAERQLRMWVANQWKPRGDRR